MDYVWDRLYGASPTEKKEEARKEQDFESGGTST